MEHWTAQFGFLPDQPRFGPFESGSLDGFPFSESIMRVNLKVPFDEKEAAKDLGAKWDAARKTGT